MLTEEKPITKNHQSAYGFHKHQCTKCSYIWEHGDECAGNKCAHTCPNCKNTIWRIYEGTIPPSDPMIFIPKKRNFRSLIKKLFQLIFDSYYYLI